MCVCVYVCVKSIDFHTKKEFTFAQKLGLSSCNFCIYPDSR